MMRDIVTQAATQSLGGRRNAGSGGICCGVLLMSAGLPLLWWNEGRSVRQYNSLQQGSKAVVSISTDVVDPSREGQLVYFTGSAVPGLDIKDALFGVGSDGALKIRRDVEMYQWMEHEIKQTKKKAGGETEIITNYTYQKEWKASAVNSANFHAPVGHANPASMPYPSQVTVADPIKVGSFRLPNSMVNMMSWFAPLSEAISVADIPDDAVRAKAKDYAGHGFFFGANPNEPGVGDARVTFKIVPQANISAVAMQTGDSFAPYPTKSGGSILFLRRGTYSAEEMFAQAQQMNEMATWFFRAVGFFLTYLGMSSALRPLSVCADAVPLVGDLVGAAANIIAFLLASILSSVVIALAWLASRPMIGGSVLLLAAGLLYLFVRNLRKNNQNEGVDSSYEVTPIQDGTYTEKEMV